MLSMSNWKTGTRQSIVGAFVLGAASTFGDWLWATSIPDGAVVPGVVHGIVFFALLAVVLASAIGTKLAWRRLLPALPLMGLVIAAAFYPIAMLIGYIGGLLVTWVAMWLGLAYAYRWAQATSDGASQALVRGLIAAVASGLAFWAISGIWTNPSAHADPLSWDRLARWVFAFLPGMGALLVGAQSSPGSKTGSS